MKSIEEIEYRLEQAEQELANVKQHNDEAFKSYHIDVKNWGKENLDRSYLDETERMVGIVTREVSVLRWILKDNL